MTQVSMDGATGLWISGFDSMMASIGRLLTTRYYERVLREYVGSPVPALLGELANPRTVIRFRWAVALTILLFEPRFVPKVISMDDLDRTGAASFTIRGIFRPRAHLGDLTEAGEVTLIIGQTGNGLIVTA